MYRYIDVHVLTVAMAKDIGFKISNVCLILSTMPKHHASTFFREI